MQDNKKALVNNGENFIVRVDDKHFFLTFGADHSDVRGTLVLSEAAHLRYIDADVLCQSLRASGYNAVVNDRYGAPVTEESLQKIDEPSLPLSLAEYNSLPAATLKRRYFTEPRFRQRFDAAVAQGIIKSPSLY
jgi:hypothetical protein